MMGESFRRWRSELNTKYIQEGLTLFKEFGKITPSQWEELVAQKTKPEALEPSARNTELAKRNKHHHHLGLDGYYAKEEQFRKMDEEVAAAGNIDVMNLKVRSRIGYMRGVQNHLAVILSLISRRPKRQYQGY